MFESISIVIPVFNNEKSIQRLADEICAVVKGLGLQYEIIFVNDGSSDHSLEVLERVSERDEMVKFIELSRNFGQHYAVTAGLTRATGDLCLIMDCDLQDSAENIGKLYEEALKGFDIVFTKRTKREHHFVKKYLTALYKWCFHIISDPSYNFDYGSMVLFTNEVREKFLLVKETSRLYLQILIWLGFKTSSVEVRHHKRLHGQSSYSVSKLINLAIDGLLFNSDRPIKLMILLGAGISTIGFLIGIYIIIESILGSQFLLGWPSLLVTILFSVGTILMSLGVLGLYVGRILIEAKGRPLFIVKREKNFD